MMVPTFVLMRKFGWVDTFLPLIIPGAANAFGIFFFRQYISSISDELLDAGRIDGASEFGIFWRIVVCSVRNVLHSSSSKYRFLQLPNLFINHAYVSHKQYLHTACPFAKSASNYCAGCFASNPCNELVASLSCGQDPNFSWSRT